MKFFRDDFGTISTFWGEIAATYADIFLVRKKDLVLDFFSPSLFT